MYSPFDRTGQNPQWNEVSTSEIDHIEFVRRVKHKDELLSSRPHHNEEPQLS